MTIDKEISDDISIPFALFLIAYLRQAMKKAKTDAEKLELLRRCFAAYLVMNAGHYLFNGIIFLTDFITTEFTPFTDGGTKAPSTVSWISKHPLTDNLSAIYLVPGRHYDLFIIEENDVFKLTR